MGSPWHTFSETSLWMTSRHHCPDCGTPEENVWRAVPSTCVHSVSSPGRTGNSLKSDSLSHHVGEVVKGKTELIDKWP